MRIIRKTIALAIIISAFVMLSLSYSLEFSGEGIDPLSLDVLIKNGLIEDIPDDIKTNYSSNIDDTSGGDHEVEAIQLSGKYIFDENSNTKKDFYITSAEVVNKSDMILLFTQRVEGSLASIDFITLKDENGNIIPRSKYRLRVSKYNPQMMIIKLREESFKPNSQYQLLVRINIQSSFGISYDMSKRSIDVITEEIITNSALKIVPYSDGVIDVYFEDEVSDTILSNIKKFKLSYGEEYKYAMLPIKGTAVEDLDGISRILRIKYGHLYEKYDYRLESYFGEQFHFPGPSEKSYYSDDNNITIIDGENIIVNTIKDIDETNEKLRIGSYGKVSISSSQIIGNQIYIAFDKSNSLDRDKQYGIILKNLYNNNIDRFESLKIPFNTFGDESFTYYIKPKIEEHIWMDDGLVKIVFNKPVLLESRLGTSLKVTDKSGNNVTCKKIYSINPMTYVLSIEGASKEELYNLSIKSLRELNKSVYTEVLEYRLSNETHLDK